MKPVSRSNEKAEEITYRVGGLVPLRGGVQYHSQYYYDERQDADQRQQRLLQQRPPPPQARARVVPYVRGARAYTWKCPFVSRRDVMQITFLSSFFKRALASK